MKVIGVTSTGNALVELYPDQVHELEQATARLAAFVAAVNGVILRPTCRADASSVQPSAPPPAQPANRKQARKAAQPTKKSADPCPICGKGLTGKRKACPGVCSKKRQRQWANAWYAKNKAVRPLTRLAERPAATPPIPPDRKQAIREALARADARLAEGMVQP